MNAIRVEPVEESIPMSKSAMRTASWIKRAGSIVALLPPLLSACGGGGGGSGWGPAGAAADTTAPITTVAPAVSGTRATATTLSVTIDEDGTGYFLVLPALAPPPTAAVVMTGTAFAMTANEATATSINGLTPATEYKIFFVAKDVAENVQTTTQSVTVTTPLADTTAPFTTFAPSVPSYSSNSAKLSVTINEDGTGYFLVRPTAAAAPTIAEVLAGTAFPMSAHVPANPTITGLMSNTAYHIHFIAKDGENNLQAAVQNVPVTTLSSEGYVMQGGLLWMPPLNSHSWPDADNLCKATIGGQTGWRMPTQYELSALYASGAFYGQGWILDYTWSSSIYSTGNHYYVSLLSTYVGWVDDYFPFSATCVR